MNALELKQKTTKELLNIAEEHGLKHVSRQKKADIIFNILKTISKDGKELLGGGILETLPDGFGFLSCLLYTSPSPRDGRISRMPSSA